MKEMLLALILVVMATSDANPGADPLLLYNTLPYPYPYTGPAYGYQLELVPPQPSQLQPGFRFRKKKKKITNDECFNNLGVQVPCVGFKNIEGKTIKKTISCKNNVGEDVPCNRAIGAWTTSDYDTKFTEDSKQLLKAYNLYNRKMVRDDSVRPSSETIEWTQASRCWWGCEEEYLLVDYYQDGDKSNPVMKVYVARSELSPPSEFWTSGYKGYLHFGFLYYGGQNQAIFFVLHPNSWGPYQHRFKTNAFTQFFNAGVGKVTSSAAGAAAGAAIGSIVPGVGTIVGGLVGAGVGTLTDDYFGDYLRYIG